ncbi:PP2C family protein-serine/threonine phosphatase [Candidatus Methylacidithermus pantelleriae]|uniref:PPM-type phosphatase domain-containing protein n=1 Tax=Candidatus Methylacidithermus pantelleriae TaxID=2744239 RepID=A0A8J2BJV4_9BACT|nr:PP2C family serine/threonine-protein phosphatase [Candidatus Methylacidithermus pantelleriae]CAF0689949.1 putative Protein phosphatase PhpP [Candidatus Methylacidithermus pantelleriae]
MKEDSLPRRPVPVLVRDAAEEQRGSFFHLGIVSEKGNRPAPNQDVSGWVWAGELSIGVGIADGMGGHKAGERASWLALGAALQTLAGQSETVSPRERLAQAFLGAWRALNEEAKHDPAVRGMGTTLTLVWLENRQAYFGHVGDCRLYVVKGKECKLLTEDHTLASELEKTGTPLFSREELSGCRHVLTRCLSPMHEAAPDIDSLSIEPPFRLILVTDGIYPWLAVKEATFLLTDDSPLAAAEKLVRIARERGGTDDRTACVMDVFEPTDEKLS